MSSAERLRRLIENEKGCPLTVGPIPNELRLGMGELRDLEIGMTHRIGRNRRPHCKAALDAIQVATD